MKNILTLAVVCLFLLSSIGLVCAEGITGDVVITVQAIGGEEEEAIVIDIDDYVTATGAVVQITEEEGKAKLKTEGVSADTNLEIEKEDVEDMEDAIKISVVSSDGTKTEIKIMPNVASAKAITALKINACNEENNCEIELKEVGSGEEAKLAYEVQAKKEVKLFGFIKKQMKVRAQIDAGNGEVIATKKPWWSFLAKETNEVESEEAAE